MSLSIQKLRSVKHLVTHAKCSDGMASAMIIKNVLPEVKVTFLIHNTKPHTELVVEEGMLFCDFTPTKERVQEFVDAGAICLDHHKHAEGVVKAFGACGIFADEKKDPGVSGAVLAYQEVWKPLVSLEWEALEQTGIPTSDNRNLEDDLVKSFAETVGVRDTWQKKDPRWDKACRAVEALSFWPEETLLACPPSQWEEKLAIGDILYPRKLERAKQSADNSFSFTTLKGTRVVVFSGTRASSDAAEYLGDKADIVVGFSTFLDEGEPVVIFSTRSHTKYDVGALSKFYGGGGHTAAAGFQIKMNTPSPPLSWWESTFFHFIFKTPPGYQTVKRGHLHPFFLAEKLVREYEGER